MAMMMAIPAMPMMVRVSNLYHNLRIRRRYQRH
jgi:hypothetical protein